MSNFDDGGPAFPHRDGPNGNCYNGMSLRDYFAAKAMQGILSDSEAINESTGKKLQARRDAKAIAYCCYVMADAMIAARESKHD